MSLLATVLPGSVQASVALLSSFERAVKIGRFVQQGNGSLYTLSRL